MGLKKPLTASYKEPTQEEKIGRCASMSCLILLVFVIISLCAILGIFFILLFTTITENTEDNRPEFNINSLSVSLLDVSPANSQITANWNTTLSVKNPSNRGTIVYDTGEVWLFYGEEFLSKGVISTPIYQGTNEEVIMVSADINQNQTAYVENWVAYEIEAERAKKGVVHFDVLVQASHCINPKFSSEKKALLKVRCRNVKVDLKADSVKGNMMLGGAQRCDFL